MTDEDADAAARRKALAKDIVDEMESRGLVGKSGKKKSEESEEETDEDDFEKELEEEA